MIGAAVVGLSLSGQRQDSHICGCNFILEDSTILLKFTLTDGRSQILFFVRMPLQIVAVQENKIRSAGSVLAPGGADLNHSTRFVSVAQRHVLRSTLDRVQLVECATVASDGFVS